VDTKQQTKENNEHSKETDTSISFHYNASMVSMSDDVRNVLVVH
jgi:hypothetical protein